MPMSWVYERLSIMHGEISGENYRLVQIWKLSSKAVGLRKDASDVKRRQLRYFMPAYPSPASNWEQAAAVAVGNSQALCPMWRLIA